MSHEEVDNLFSYHELDRDGIQRINVFRDQYKKLAHSILNGTNPSPEQTLCIRRLHESMMQINILISSEYPME